MLRVLEPLLGHFAALSLMRSKEQEPPVILTLPESLEKDRKSHADGYAKNMVVNCPRHKSH